MNGAAWLQAGRGTGVPGTSSYLHTLAFTRACGPRRGSHCPIHPPFELFLFGSAHVLYKATRAGPRAAPLPFPCHPLFLLPRTCLQPDVARTESERGRLLTWLRWRRGGSTCQRTSFRLSHGPSSAVRGSWGLRARLARAGLAPLSPSQRKVGSQGEPHAESSPPPVPLLALHPSERARKHLTHPPTFLPSSSDLRKGGGSNDLTAHCVAAGTTPPQSCTLRHVPLSVSPPRPICPMGLWCLDVSCFLKEASLLSSWCLRACASLQGR